MEVLRRLRQQRPDVFDKLEGMWVFCLVNHCLTLNFEVYIDGTRVKIYC
jgi:hypothetical protein